MSVSLLVNELADASVYGATLAVMIAPGSDLTAADSTWSFTDVTEDVLFANPVTVSMGRSDEQSQSQTASCSFTLLNDDGDYTPRRPAGAFYPNMRIGFPVKVIVNTAATGDVELFTGYVEELTPSWDETMRIATVEFTAKGSIQRLQLADTPVRSAASGIALDSSLLDTVASYWPVLDGTDATSIGSGLPGGTPMVLEGGTMEFGAYSGFPGSEPIATFGAGANLHGDVDNTRADTTGAAYFRCLLGVSTALADQIPMMQWLFSGGTISRAELKYRTGGGLSLHFYNLSGTSVYDSGAVAFSFDADCYIAFETTQNGANIDVTLYTGEVASLVAAQITPTIAGQTIGEMTHYDVGASGTMAGWSIGHIGVSNDPSWFLDTFDIVNGYLGEEAADRLTRVGDETGIPILFSGNPQIVMGTQPLGTLLDVLSDIEATDHGVLYDGRFFGLVYDSRGARENAGIDITLDIATGDVMHPFDPMENTRLVRNDVTAKRREGTSARRVTDSGEPYDPSVVGTFSGEYNVNPGSDPVVPGHASWLLHLGTVDLDRFPELNLNFAASPQLAIDWLNSGLVGTRITVTGLPSTGGYDPDLFVEGFSMTISPQEWFLSANCSPATPYDVALVDSDRVQTSGSTLATNAAQGATSLSVTVSIVWGTSAGTFDLSVGGHKVSCTAISGASSPQTFTVSSLPRAVTSGSEVKVWKDAIVALEAD